MPSEYPNKQKYIYIYTLYLIQIFKYFIFFSRIKELFHL